MQICEYAKNICYDWWVDILKQGSARREKIDIPFLEALQKMDSKSHFTIIKRSCHIDYLEVSISNFESPSHFVWICIHKERAKELLERFDFE